MSREIKNHIQSLKDEGIRVNIDDEQVDNLVNKILRGISLGDTSLEDTSLGDTNLGDTSLGDTSLGDTNIEKFLNKYADEPINTYYKDMTLSADNIHNNLNDYVEKIITKDEFLQAYNVFVNEFDAFSNAQGKKSKGAVGPNQKKLLKYGNKLKKIVDEINFKPKSSGSGLKILTPQQMLTRLPISLAQLQAGNNSQKLKNETCKKKMYTGKKR